jgi:NTP pyrophosphatase (non-canonical NTP hydrolase)
LDIKELQRDIHKVAVELGWWEKERNIPECLCLIHSEVSEALEDYRDNHMESTIIVSGPKTGKPIGFPTELADIMIRTMDLAEGMGIDLEKEILKKHEYNRTRPYKHGGKRA